MTNTDFVNIYIFVYTGNMYKLVINHTRKMFTLYGYRNHIVMRRECMTKYQLREVENAMIKYVNSKKLIQNRRRTGYGYGVPFV